MNFDGSTYDAQQDFHRLRGQLDRVKNLMLDGHARTLEEIADATNVPLSTVGSRLRDLRKIQFGALTVISRRVSKGTWVYHVPQQPKIVYDDQGQGIFGMCA